MRHCYGSGVRSNLTVGPPIDLQLYEADALALSRSYHFTAESEYLRRLEGSWHDMLMDAFHRLPKLDANVPSDGGVCV